MAGHAAAEEGPWEIAIIGGVYKPSLRTLNQVLREPELAILQDPNQQLQPNPLFTPEIRNLSIPSINIDRTFGVEASRRVTPRNYLTLTLNVWKGESEATDIAPQITSSTVDFQNVPRSSRYEVFLTQIWVGWRYFFLTPLKGADSFLT